MLFDFKLDVDRIEIGNEDYRIYRTLGDKDAITSTVSLSGKLVGSDGRVILQITVPYESKLSQQLLDAKRSGNIVAGFINL